MRAPESVLNGPYGLWYGEACKACNAENVRAAGTVVHVFSIDAPYSSAGFGAEEADGESLNAFEPKACR